MIKYNPDKDNMLFMVIVPIITSILNPDRNNPTVTPHNTTKTFDENEDISIGILFASKAIVQLLGIFFIYN